MSPERLKFVSPAGGIRLALFVPEPPPVPASFAADRSPAAPSRTPWNAAGVLTLLELASVPTPTSSLPDPPIPAPAALLFLGSGEDRRRCRPVARV